MKNLKLRTCLAALARRERLNGVWLGCIFLSVAALGPFSDAAGGIQGDTKAATTLRYEGVASCAVSGCHNATQPKNGKGGEYGIWIDDPHARAYAVLREPHSRQIEQRLKRLASVGQAKPEQNELCLSCHATPAVQRGELFSVLDGVGCESCHGPAEKWRGKHYQAEWKTLSDADKAALGLQPTKNLRVSAQICATCHVGSERGEVNHDLIAAGHPPLRFEFGAYLANLPRHWDRAWETRQPAFEARAWFVGQLVSARAALELLSVRARGKDRPWPEFAEHDCFACHHDLSGQSLSGRRPSAPPGSLVLSPWYQAIPRLLAGQPDFANPRFLEQLDAVEVLMRRPFAERREVGLAAAPLSHQMGTWLDGWDTQAVKLAPLDKTLQAVAQLGAKRTDLRWDEAMQLSLALAALDQARQGADKTSPLRAPLRRLLDQLRFPDPHDSPHAFRPDQLDRHFKEILKSLHP